MCSACGGKLTAGFPKGRKERYAKYWCCNPECTRRVGVSRDVLENAFLGILGRMAPTPDLWSRLPAIRKELLKRLEPIKADRKAANEQIARADTLNRGWGGAVREGADDTGRPRGAQGT